MNYDLFRDINIVFPGLIFFLLLWRTITSWRADWARPDHVIHYRVLLVILNLFVILSSLAALQYEASNSPAGPISPAYTALSLVVLIACWRWPRPFKDRQ